MGQMIRFPVQRVKGRGEELAANKIVNVSEISLKTESIDDLQLLHFPVQPVHNPGITQAVITR